MEGEEPPVMPRCGDEVGGRKRGDGGRKRRFSDAQVRSLECTFEAQGKLEPRRKAQLAGELGLQPRQVSVWFQNRRARWKSKQLERDYGALRADYDALLSNFECLQREKKSLAAQLQSLAELLGKSTVEESKGSIDGDHSKGDEDRNRSSLPMEVSVDRKLPVAGSEGELIVYTEEVGLCFSEPTNIGSSDLAERRGCFDTASSFSDDQSCGTSSTWWELWSLDI